MLSTTSMPPPSLKRIRIWRKCTLGWPGNKQARSVTEATSFEQVNRCGVRWSEAVWRAGRARRSRRARPAQSQAISTDRSLFQGFEVIDDGVGVFGRKLVGWHRGVGFAAFGCETGLHVLAEPRL